MKKLILANCILAVAVIFSFCAKPELNEELGSVNATDAVTERGTCTLTNLPPFNTATLTFCGTNTNTTGCLSCKNTLSQGVEIVPATSVNLTLQTPITFSVRADKQTAVNFSTGVGFPTGPVEIAAGECRVFAIDNNCNITLLK